MKFIFYDNQISYIDISILKELYYNDSLKGASILHKLFNFNDLQDMDYTMRKENDTYMLFHDLNITFDSWILLFNFIKTSSVYSLKNKDIYDILNDINITANKLGGIPSFDSYYKEMMDLKTKNEKIKLNTYNPLTPEQDIHCKYNWILGSMHNIYNCGYSYTINANNSNNLDMYYMRKLIIDD